MTAVLPDPSRPASVGATTASGLMDTPAPALRAALRLRALLGILTAFWIYVTLSNTLYAHSMQYYLTGMGTAGVFASWDARLLQHLFLYPLLVGCVLLSMRITWRPAWRTWPLQVLIGLGFSVLASPALILGEHLTAEHLPDHGDMPSSMAGFWNDPDQALWLSSVTNFVLTYGFCLALVTGFNVYQRYRDSQLRVEALEHAWSAARLATLRAQLSPHTLFNLLHTIRGQIGWDPQQAQAMVVQLGDLLRRLLNAGERDFSRLSDELHFVHSYLELQKQRFPDRLTVKASQVDVLAAVWVPSLILQPLIENAVAHGLSGHEGAVTIGIEVEANDQQLIVRISNTIAPSRAPGADGLGLRNVRERLAVQFPGKASLEAGPAENGEWVATVRLPVLRDGPTTPSTSKQERRP
ncbi:MAG: histidine kinase [Gammaproteobacteria bacterium]